MADKCGFTGCNHAATWHCRKLFGKGGLLLTCNDHKPDIANRPESLKHLPFFYEITAIETVDMGRVKPTLRNAVLAATESWFTALDPDVHTELLAYMREALALDNADMERSRIVAHPYGDSGCK